MTDEELNKAAEEYAFYNFASPDYNDQVDWIGYCEKVFLAGAKWMAEQGETQEHFVIGTIADSPGGPAIVCYTNEFEIGDKVIIQIRKKD